MLWGWGPSPGVSDSLYADQGPGWPAGLEDTIRGVGWDGWGLI